MMLQKDQDNNKEQKVPFNLQFIHVLQLHSKNYLSSLWCHWRRFSFISSTATGARQAIPSSACHSPVRAVQSILQSYLLPMVAAAVQQAFQAWQQTSVRTAGFCVAVFSSTLPSSAPAASQQFAILQASGPLADQWFLKQCCDVNRPQTS